MLGGGGGYFFRQLVRRGRLDRRPAAGGRRSGTSSGPATSPTTPWRRCAPRSAARARTVRVEPPRAPGWASSDADRIARPLVPTCPARGGPPTVAGRWSLTPRARDRSDPARARRRRGDARAARRRHPRRGRRASGCPADSRPSTRCCRPSRSPGAAAAATSSPGSAPPSSVRRAPSTGCGRSRPTASRPADHRAVDAGAGGDRPRQPVRRRAALAGAGQRRRQLRAPPGPQGRRHRGGRRRPPRALRRARRPHPAHLHRSTRCASSLPPTPWRSRCATAHSAG